MPLMRLPLRVPGMTWGLPSIRGPRASTAVAAGDSCTVRGPVFESPSRISRASRSTWSQRNDRISFLRQPVSSRRRIAIAARAMLPPLCSASSSTVRHGDETGWRIQSLSEAGRSTRAWLWTSVSEDAVYFYIDPSRNAEVAKRLFGGASCTLFLVCDRHSAYKKLARELDGAVVLALCWVHQRRDFIECAAGHVRFTRWCQGWIERIASIYQLNDARLVHYDHALENQTPAFAQAQRTLEVEVDRLFAHAEAELAGLTAGSLKARPLRSLLNHREGLSVFVDRPRVPMDNNAAERALRGPVIGRRLSFGSDSETGALFTALMYSVVGTLATNGINVRHWLEAWLRACADNGGRAPQDLL